MSLMENNEVLSEEEEMVMDEKPVEEKENTYTMREILQLVMGSREPVSEDPRYLYYIKNYIGTQTDVPISLSLLLPHFSSVAKYLQKNEKRLKKNGYLACLEFCQEAKVITSQMSLSASLVTKLMKYVLSCNQTCAPSLEDLQLLVPISCTSMLPTTVVSATVPAGASGSKKRALCVESESEDELSDDDLFLSASDKPTYPTFSNIYLRDQKDAKCKSSVLEDTWKDSKLKLSYWKVEDLGGKRKEEEWKCARKTMMLNFDSTLPDGLIIMEAIRAIENKTKKHLKRNGGNAVERRRERRYW